MTSQKVPSAPQVRTFCLHVSRTIADYILAKPEPHTASSRNVLSQETNVHTDKIQLQTEFSRAVALQQELEVQLLLEKGADITTRIDSGETALHIAAKNGSKRIMQLFLEKAQTQQ